MPVATANILLPTLMKREWWDYARDILASATNKKPSDLQGMDLIEAAWRENKENLMPAFDSDGRRTITVSSEIADNELPDLMNSINIFNERFVDRLLDREPAYSLFSGLLSRIRSSAAWIGEILAQLFTVEELSQNRISSTRHKYTDTVKTFPAGTKLFPVMEDYIDSKAEFVGRIESCSRIAYRYSRTDFMQFVSTVVSQYTFCFRNRKDSTMILSINPVDMLFASVHTDSGWKSCHNIFHGEWKSGPLAYMLDSSSAILFTTSESKSFEEEGIVIPDYPVKDWRAMAFFNIDERKAVISRNYPGFFSYYDTPSAKLVYDALRDMSGGEFEEFDRVRHTCDGNKSYINGGPYNYTDAPQITILLPGGDRRAEIEIGNSTMYCPVCGKVRRDGITDNINCGRCDIIEVECSRCHELEDVTTMVSFEGQLYCHSCISSVAVECYECRTYVRKEEAVEVHVGIFSHRYFCKHCAEENTFTCSHCGEVHTNRYKLIDLEHPDDVSCTFCFKGSQFFCTTCGVHHPVKDFTVVKGSPFCNTILRCTSCGKVSPELANSWDKVCNECVAKAQTETVEERASSI
jgi:hypothetical protein